MLVVIRFRDGGQPESMAADLSAAVQLLASKPGCEDAWVGRNVDDPELWTMVTRWADPGSYRRALSSYEVKMHVVPVLNRALDEPSAYEPLTGELNVNIPR